MEIDNLRKLQKMKNTANVHIDDAKNCLSSNYNRVDNHLKQVQDEYHRVAELSGQAALVIDNIDKEFKEKTKLNDVDMVFLFTAIALQCARQYVFSNDKFRITAVEGDNMMEKVLSPLPPSKKDILTQSVPYDAISTSDLFDYSTELSGTTHRYRTLGHDPLLGWIFGTANILTGSLTKYNFETFSVNNMVITRHYPMGTSGMLNRAASWSQQDPSLLAVAVGRQAVHFGSDYFTKQGLPIPMVSTINNDLAAKMTRDWHIDLRSVSRGATLSVLINQLIVCIHRLFYDEIKDGTKSMYEVRTRKILSYSNAIASGSNTIYVAMTGDMTKLDVGGLIVTLYRIVSDYKFINQIKKDFLKDEIYNQIIGSEYDFVEGDI